MYLCDLSEETSGQKKKDAKEEVLSSNREDDRDVFKQFVLSNEFKLIKEFWKTTTYYAENVND